MSDQPMFDELAGAERILAMLRRRRQVLLEQQAQQGSQTPPGIRLEIDGTNEEIRLQETEIKRIQTEAAVDQYPLAEACYRRLLAEQLDNEVGRLTTVGSTRLEELRLQLGITPERAEQLEHEIRVSLAKEAFMELQLGVLNELMQVDHEMHFRPGSQDRLFIAFRTIGRAVRYDADTALNLARQSMPIYGPFAGFRPTLLSVNKVSEYSGDLHMFEQFLRRLEQRDDTQHGQDA